MKLLKFSVAVALILSACQSINAQLLSPPPSVNPAPTLITTAPQKIVNNEAWHTWAFSCNMAAYYILLAWCTPELLRKAQGYVSSQNKTVCKPDTPLKTLFIVTGIMLVFIYVAPLISTYTKQWKVFQQNTDQDPTDNNDVYYLTRIVGNGLACLATLWLGTQVAAWLKYAVFQPNAAWSDILICLVAPLLMLMLTKPLTLALGGWVRSWKWLQNEVSPGVRAPGKLYHSASFLGTWLLSCFISYLGDKTWWKRIGENTYMCSTSIDELSYAQIKVHAIAAKWWIYIVYPSIVTLLAYCTEWLSQKAKQLPVFKKANEQKPKPIKGYYGVEFVAQGLWIGLLTLVMYYTATRGPLADKATQNGFICQSIWPLLYTVSRYFTPIVSQHVLKWGGFQKGEGV